MSQDRAETVDLTQRALPHDGGRPAHTNVPIEPVTPTKAAPKLEQGALITCENLVKIYKVADLEVVALQGLDLIVQPAEVMGIVGSSGSGKSTLLNVLGGLDRPSAGRVNVAGRDLLKMSEWGLVKYKR